MAGSLDSTSGAAGRFGRCVDRLQRSEAFRPVRPVGCPVGGSRASKHLSRDVVMSNLISVGLLPFHFRCRQHDAVSGVEGFLAQSRIVGARSILLVAAELSVELLYDL